MAAKNKPPHKGYDPDWDARNPGAWDDKPEAGRDAVPLVMLPGNMKILLEQTIPCKGISLKHSDEYEGGVVLMVHGADHEVCEQLGFKLGGGKRKK